MEAHQAFSRRGRRASWRIAWRSRSVCCASTRSWRGCGSRGRTLSISALCACSASNRSAFLFSTRTPFWRPPNAGGRASRFICPIPAMCWGARTPIRRCGWRSCRRLLGRGATGWVGASLDLLFLLSLAVVLRPRTAKELFILGAAAVSPMTVYALERANNDLVVFLLVICGAIAVHRPAALTGCSPMDCSWPPASSNIIRSRCWSLSHAKGGGTRWSLRPQPISALILFGVAFYPELRTAAGEHPGRILLFHRRLLRPEPAVRFRGSPGRRCLPHPDRSVAAGRAVGVGSCANASHGSAARARATRLGGERDAVPRHRRLVGCGLLLCRPERRLIAAFFFSRCCPGWSASIDRSKTERYDDFAAR